MADLFSTATDGSALGLRVFGYSERGVFNALFYEIAFSPSRCLLLAELLSRIRVPGSSPDFHHATQADVLIEQSLSDFGDADAIIVLRGPKRRQVVFIEGKVKPAQSKNWSIKDAWRDFLTLKNGRRNSSNLFTQLYHKVRFIAALKKGGFDLLERGVPFPACSSKRLRKIGSNPVVRRAAKLIEDFAQEVFFVALVPDSEAEVARFFSQDLKQGPGEDLTGWDTRGWGFLTWAQVEEFCREHRLENTLRVFEYNREQIYPSK